MKRLLILTTLPLLLLSSCIEKVPEERQRFIASYNHLKSDMDTFEYLTYSVRQARYVKSTNEYGEEITLSEIHDSDVYLCREGEEYRLYFYDQQYGYYLVRHLEDYPNRKTYILKSNTYVESDKQYVSEAYPTAIGYVYKATKAIFNNIYPRYDASDVAFNRDIEDFKEEEDKVSLKHGNYLVEAEYFMNEESFKSFEMTKVDGKTKIVTTFSRVQYNVVKVPAAFSGKIAE